MAPPMALRGMTGGMPEWQSPHIFPMRGDALS